MPCASGAKRVGGGGKAEKCETEKGEMQARLRKQCPSAYVVIGQKK